MENSLYDCCISCSAANSHIKSEERRKRQEEEEGPERKSRRVMVEGVTTRRAVELYGCKDSLQVVLTVNAPAGFKLDLDYLPNSDGGWDIAATSTRGGLLLCNPLDSQLQYLICNPLSKQWIRLPRAPKTYTHVHLGFIHDPCCGSSDAAHEPLTCSSCRLKVIRFPHSNIVRSDFQIATYSSETGEWTNAHVKSPKSFDWYDLENVSVFHNSCFHWLAGHFEIVLYDPYKNKLHGRISGPPQLQSCQTYSNTSLGLSHGSIWLSQYSSTSGFLRIWELAGSYGNLDPSGHLNVDDFSWRQHRLFNLFELSPSITASTLAFHPDDPDIIYAQDFADSTNWIVECNLRNKSVGQPKLGAPYLRICGGELLTLVLPHTLSEH